MEIEVTETVNQESDITDSDLEDVDDIMHSVFGDDEGADMDRSCDSEASSVMKATVMMKPTVMMILWM